MPDPIPAVVHPPVGYARPEPLPHTTHYAVQYQTWIEPSKTSPGWWAVCLLGENTLERARMTAQRCVRGGDRNVRIIEIPGARP